MAIAVPLAMAAMAATSSVMADKAQGKADKAYNKALLSSTVDKYQQLDKQESDLIFDTHTKSIGAQKQFLQARAAVTAQAGATGAAGQSVDLAVEDLRTGLGGRISDITHEGTSQLDNINQVAKDTRRGFTNNARAVTKPSAFKALYSGASAYVGAQGMGRSVATAKRSSAQANTNS